MCPGLPATFRGIKGQGSWIDFVCTRLKQVEFEAKQCAPIPSCPLLGTFTQGHIPLIGSVTLAWKPWSGVALSTVSYAHRTRARSERACTSEHLSQVTWPCDGQFRHFHQHLNELLL